MLSVTVAPTGKAKCSRSKELIPVRSLRLTNEFTRGDGKSMSTNQILTNVSSVMAKRALASPLTFAFLPNDEAAAMAKQVLAAIAENEAVKEEWKAFRCGEKTLKRPRAGAVDYDSVPDHMKSAVEAMFFEAFKKYAKLGGKADPDVFLEDFVKYIRFVLQAKKGVFAEGDGRDEDANGDFLFPTSEEAVAAWEEETGGEDVRLFDAALSAAASSTE